MLIYCNGKADWQGPAQDCDVSVTLHSHSHCGFSPRMLLSEAAYASCQHGSFMLRALWSAVDDDGRRVWCKSLALLIPPSEGALRCARRNMRGKAGEMITCSAAQVSVSIAELEAIHERDSAAHAQVRISWDPNTPCGSTGSD